MTPNGSMSLEPIVSWFQYKKVQKNRIQAQKVLMELNALTVTVHGRTMLQKVCQDPDNGLPDEIRHMYMTLVMNAPIKYFAQWN